MCIVVGQEKPYIVVEEMKRELVNIVATGEMDAEVIIVGVGSFERHFECSAYAAMLIPRDTVETKDAACEVAYEASRPRATYPSSESVSRPCNTSPGHIPVERDSDLERGGVKTVGNVSVERGGAECQHQHRVGRLSSQDTSR